MIMTIYDVVDVLINDDDYVIFLYIIIMSYRHGYT